MQRLCLRLALGLAGLAGAAAKDNWAVLIAGSKKYINYRHQADICHAYKVLTERGFDPDKIITMIFDDVANSTENPYPGRLYNRPAKTMDDAVDVYAGCKKDYTNLKVNPGVFVAVLTGDEEKAGGRVLKSTSEDNVFVNFVAHGGVGLIGFPENKPMQAKRLVSTLETMHSKGMYKQLVFYLETCDSGSMFKGLLKPDLPVYAVTSANEEQTSSAFYCEDRAKVGNKTLNTCLADWFEINWLTDSEGGTANETLGQQYAAVKKGTKWSNVMQYGQVTVFNKELVSDFLGTGKAVGVRGAEGAGQAAPPPGSAVSARDVKLRLLYWEYERTGSAEASERLAAEIRDREAVRALGLAIAEKVVGGGEQAKALLGAPISSNRDFYWTPTLAACHERAVEAFGASCGWTENRLVLSKALYQLCEQSADDAAPVAAAVGAACGTAAAERDVNFLV